MTPELKSRIRSTIQKCKALLMQETAEQLEAVYGHNLDGRTESVDNLPEVLADEARQKTLHLLIDFLREEELSGLYRPEALAKLVNEAAFTHLNRLVALKMMESRRLIRQAVARGLESNGFKFYLADHPEAMTRYQRGETGEAYQEFLLWQYGEISSGDHLEVLFDPESLASRLFPRSRTLTGILDLLNDPGPASVWEEDETIGWVYQYFIEEDKDRIFDKIYKQKQKMALRDIPKATQIFTPRWIVEYLVHNTLGRLWLRMHPDSRLQSQMKYYVPNPYNDREPVALKPCREITLLDTACGTMHFGLVAFDLFHEMYLEEMTHRGEAGWPTRQESGIESEAEIPQAIIENNIYGIDIDLRAIQLSALTLYLKMKSRHPQSRLRRMNLTYTDFPAIPDAELPAFIEALELKHPIARELMAEILPELNKAYYLGSLLKIEERVMPFLEARRREVEKFPLLAGIDAEMADGEDAELFWRMIRDEIILGLQKAEQHLTAGQALIAGAQIQGLGLVDALLRKYDVVVANPPYMGNRHQNPIITDYIKKMFPGTERNLYTAFIKRCLELVNSTGFVGMITGQTFMFTSSFESLRKDILSETSINSFLHFDYGLFPDVRMDTSSFILEPVRHNSHGVFFRLIKGDDSEKYSLFQKALSAWQSHGESASDRHIFVVRQEDFKAIPAWPFVYWITPSIRKLFSINKPLSAYARLCRGNATNDNFRFIRKFWELGHNSIFYNCSNDKESKGSDKTWYPYMKGGEVCRWYGNQEDILNWKCDGNELKAWASHLYTSWSRIVKNVQYFFQEGITYSALTVSNSSFRYMPKGFIFDQASNAIFTSPKNLSLIALLNSHVISLLQKVINPTVNITVQDLGKIPIPSLSNDTILSSKIVSNARYCVLLKKWSTMMVLVSWEFKYPSLSVNRSIEIEKKISILEAELNELILNVFNFQKEELLFINESFGSLSINLKQEIDLDDHTLIEKIRRLYLNKNIPEEVLSGQSIEMETLDESDEDDRSTRQARYLTFEEICRASGFHPDTVYEVLTSHDWQRPEERFEQAYSWLEYAFGILMGRFKPGRKGELGSAIIHKTDFITGSLAISDQEFNEITRHFPVSYEDEQGKHAFPKALEEKLCSLADADGIMVLDSGHPDDLPARLEETLALLLGDKEAAEAIAALIGENLPDRDKFRRFLERDFFSKHHLKMYRKRPIYWLLQSGKKSYGFYLFHERLNSDTLYKLQRVYIDPKLNHIDQRIRDLGRKMASLEGAAQRQAGREREALQELYQEIKTFSEAISRVIQMQDETGKTVGYDPDINDGVILNMAPLHTLIPWSEPEAYWKELQSGRYDWAHLAMRYWPLRVREKCKTDKSLAIAHGVEEI